LEGEMMGSYEGIPNEGVGWASFSSPGVFVVWHGDRKMLPNAVMIEWAVVGEERNGNRPQRRASRLMDDAERVRRLEAQVAQLEVSLARWHRVARKYWQMLDEFDLGDDE
jgi:hypothetical protein